MVSMKKMKIFEFKIRSSAHSWRREQDDVRQKKWKEEVIETAGAYSLVEKKEKDKPVDEPGTESEEEDTLIEEPPPFSATAVEKPIVTAPVFQRMQGP
ncbi:hypothetical protein NDU88_002462 [Pleurodeles waltl]|uniref:Uncharacterized protein n=1 Tax=Pleurodeles waltl TaxID=8319 RepID=A0AAV7TLQ4_PLEWA|nr:hypothetical protein NDU88_002462 [Pleurodeles waltl]